MLSSDNFLRFLRISVLIYLPGFVGFVSCAMDDDFEEEKGWGGDTPDGDVSCF